MRIPIALGMIGVALSSTVAAAQSCASGHWEYLEPRPPLGATILVAAGRAWAIDAGSPAQLRVWEPGVAWNRVATLGNVTAPAAWEAISFGQRAIIRGLFQSVDGAPATGVVMLDAASAQVVPLGTSDASELAPAAGILHSDGTNVYRVFQLDATTLAFRRWDGSQWYNMPNLYWSPWVWTRAGLDGLYYMNRSLQTGLDPVYYSRFNMTTGTWESVGTNFYPIPTVAYNGVRAGAANYADCASTGCMREGYIQFSDPAGGKWYFDRNPCNVHTDASVSDAVGIGRYFMARGGQYIYRTCEDQLVGSHVVFDFTTMRPSLVPPHALQPLQPVGAVGDGILCMDYRTQLPVLWRAGCGCDAPVRTVTVDAQSLGRRVLPAVAWNSNVRQFIAFGGRMSDGSDSGDTLVWDGESWSRLLMPGPAARADHAMASSSDGYTYVFGGKTSNNNVLGDMWSFDGMQWGPLALTSLPSARGGHGMVFHEPQRVFVMFGGFESSGLAAPQTHVFSPDTYQWTISTAIGPSARFAHAMAFDPIRGRTVLFGGYDSVAPYLGDTWVFDGYSWVRHNGPGPSPRFYATLHWDDVLGGLRLTGGRDQTGALNDQWLLTSTGWHLIDEPLPTGPRWAHAAASSWDGNQLIIGGLDVLDAARSETLTVTRLPAVLSAPQNVVVPGGQTVTLHVTVNDPAAQVTWLRNGQPVVASDRISGVQTTTLTIRETQPHDEGHYSVTITNCAGTTVSAIAMLSLAACDSIDFNNNGVFPEDQDVVDFFTVLAGGSCATCNDIDFNNNQVFPEDQDVIDFFNVLAGSTCP